MKIYHQALAWIIGMIGYAICHENGLSDTATYLIGYTAGSISAFIILTRNESA
jgi:hypothetical protein